MTPDYIVFKSAATKQGHYGLIAGFARHRPYGTVQGQRRKLFFHESHFAIIAYDPEISSSPCCSSLSPDDSCGCTRPPLWC